MTVLSFHEFCYELYVAREFLHVRLHNDEQAEEATVRSRVTRVQCEECNFYDSFPTLEDRTSEIEVRAAFGKLL